MIDDVLARYEPDGIEMDWMRMPLCCPPGAKPETLAMMTDWIGELRRVTHGTMFGARVPAKLDALRTFGLDVAAIAQRGHLDYVAPTNFYQCAWETPFDRLRRDLGDQIAVYGVIEDTPNWLFVRHNDGRLAFRMQSASAPLLRGLAAAHLARGADGIYLFNFFCSDPRFTQYETIAELNNLDQLRGQPKHYTLATAYNYWSPRFTEHAEQLPTTLEAGLWRTFHVPACAEPPAANLELVAQIVTERASGESPRFGISLNGSWPEFNRLQTEALLFPCGAAVGHAPQHTAFDYPLPLDRLRDGLNELTVYHASEDTNPHPDHRRDLVRIVSLELAVRSA